MVSRFGVLIIGLNELLPSDVIKMISNEDVNTQDIDGFCRGSWEITNKYYNADVYLYGLKNKDRLTSKLEFHMEAVIIYFDSKLVQDIREFEYWLMQINIYHPSVCILLCNTYEVDANVPRTCIEQWCVHYSFELVELKPQVNATDDLADNDAEAFGIERVKQALQSHVWPNLRLKECSRKSSIKTGDRQKRNTKIGDDENHAEFDIIENEFRMMELEENYLNDLGDDDERLLSATDRFDELLINLNSWRNGLSKMTPEQKLDTATKLVSQAFQSIVLAPDDDECGDRDDVENDNNDTDD